MTIQYLKQKLKRSEFMFIGNSKVFTTPTINKFLLGYFQTKEFINMSSSRKLLIWQTIPLIKGIYKEKSFFRKNYFFFASQSFTLQSIIKKSALYSSMIYNKFPWVNGTLTAAIKMKKTPDCVILPETSQSFGIIIEANVKLIPTIALVNSNNNLVRKISHPVFGNDNDLLLCEFFCLLCAYTIVKCELEENITFEKTTRICYVHYFRRLKKKSLIKNRNLYRVYVKKSWYPKKNTIKKKTTMLNNLIKNLKKLQNKSEWLVLIDNYKKRWKWLYIQQNWKENKIF